MTDGDDLPAPGNDRIGHRRIGPLSPSQRRIWFLSRLHPGSATWALPVVLRIDGPLDPRLLGTALACVVNRHGTLTGRIAEQDGEVVHLAATWPAELPVVRLEEDPGEHIAPGDLPALTLEDGHLLAARLIRLRPESHLLHLCIHHLACDGASVPLLVEELSTAYEALVSGRAPETVLPPLPVRYADYVRVQRERAQAPATLEKIESWRSALAGAEELDLVTDRPRTFPLSFRSRSHHFGLGRELAEEVRAFCLEHRVTPFATLAAVFAVTLSRRSGGQRDFMIGVPHLGRDHLEWQQLIGLFANIVPLRVRLPAGQSFIELVRLVRAQSIRCLEDGDVPFERIVDALRPHRDLTRFPLCPASFQVLYGLLSARSTGDPSFRQLHADSEATEFEVTMYFDADDDMPGIIEYAADLFDDATITRLAGEYRELCAALVRRPYEPVEWSGPAAPPAQALVRDPPSEATLHELVARQAAGDPAVIAGDDALTYAGLDGTTNGLAARLRSSGVNRGDVVAIAVGRGAATVVAMLGVLKAGAAFLPLDPGTPDRVLATMVSVAAPVAAVVDRAHDRLARALGLTAVPVDGPAAPPPAGRVRPDDLAYVMFTSGTTGEPKAVAVTHRGVVSLAHDPAYVQIGPGDVVAQIAPASFDASTLEIWTALLNGATLAVAPTTLLSPRDLEEFVVRHRVTVLHLTAGLMRMVVDERIGLFSRLKCLLTGGDVISADHIGRLRAACPKLRITACYGPTEVTVLASTARLEHVDPRRPVPIGRPLPHRELHVVDPRGVPAPPGVPGEVLVGGAGLARGYLRRPGLTAECFVPHPFLPGARLYRTGDLARLDAEGTAHFLGRTDRQVKIRGFRVEIEAIEAVLGTHPAVRECSIGPRELGGHLSLVGYCVAARDTTEADLIGFLKERVPGHAVPARVLLLDSFPLTPQGKIDRAALRALALAAPAAGTAARPASGPCEQIVAEAWRAVLELAQLDVDADFFEIGGHSLAALRVTARLERELGRPVPISAIFTARTVRRLAASLGEPAATDPLLPAPGQAPAASGENPAPAVSAEAAVLALTGATPEELASLLETFDGGGRP